MPVVDAHQRAVMHRPVQHPVEGLEAGHQHRGEGEDGGEGSARAEAHGVEAQDEREHGGHDREEDSVAEQLEAELTGEERDVEDAPLRQGALEGEAGEHRDDREAGEEAEDGEREGRQRQRGERRRRHWAPGP